MMLVPVSYEVIPFLARFASAAEQAINPKVGSLSRATGAAASLQSSNAGELLATVLAGRW